MFIDAFDETLEPRYAKLLTCSMYLSSISIVGGISVSWLMTLIFLILMVRPTSDHTEEN